MSDLSLELLIFLVFSPCDGRDVSQAPGTQNAVHRTWHFRTVRMGLRCVVGISVFCVLVSTDMDWNGMEWNGMEGDTVN